MICFLKSHPKSLTLVGACLAFFVCDSASVFAQKKDAKKRPGPSIVWVNQPTEKQLPMPPNTQHLTFRSKLVNEEVGHCVYLPPQYESAPDQSPDFG